MVARNLGFAVVMLNLLLYACGGSYVAPVTERSENYSQNRQEISQKKARIIKYHTVKPGDTLYSIASSYGVNYRDLARWNGIASPYRIQPKQKVLINPSSMSESTATSSAGRGHGQGYGKGYGKGHGKGSKPQHSRRSEYQGRGIPAQIASQTPALGKQTANTRHEPARQPQPQATDLTWMWPTQGNLDERYSDQQVGKKGIVISGTSGTPIFAAASGKVVYSGSGLLRYGKLIIIKHDKTYISAYAHNRRLLVSEGKLVRKGQRIAEMGSTGANRAQLHFEIRRDGKPVDPLKYLPPR